MSIAYWSVFIAALLPYLSVGAVKLGGGINNRGPRESFDRLEGWRRRVEWAHRNHFEAFAPFAAAVVIAVQAGVPSGRIDLLAGLFIAVRIAYTFAYALDLAVLRSALWAVGYIAVLALLGTAAG
jgi:uncharacterized MAPEG superfamily protein